MFGMVLQFNKIKKWTLFVSTFWGTDQTRRFFDFGFENLGGFCKHHLNFIYDFGKREIGFNHIIKRAKAF